MVIRALDPYWSPTSNSGSGSGSGKNKYGSTTLNIIMIIIIFILIFFSVCYVSYVDPILFIFRSGGPSMHTPAMSTLFSFSYLRTLESVVEQDPNQGDQIRILLPAPDRYQSYVNAFFYFFHDNFSMLFKILKSMTLSTFVADEKRKPL